MPTVLVVDDSPVDRRLVTGLLEKNSDLTVEATENGASALERMKESLPELIVTDMQMPDMSGLDLVVTTRLQYPDIPIVLMTAHGSESLAVAALEQGAASYVPKSELADKLCDTVDEVLTATRRGQSYEKLIGCLKRTDFSYELSSDVSLIDPLVEMVQEMVSGMTLCDFNGRVRLGIALKEALLNAFYHGILEISVEEMQAGGKDRQRALVEKRRSDSQFRDRKVFVDVEINRDEANFVIRDEGKGFDVSTVPERNDPHSIESKGGRGLGLIMSFMDEVRFNEQGNQISMTKRRSTSMAGQ